MTIKDNRFKVEWSNIFNLSSERMPKLNYLELPWYAISAVKDEFKDQNFENLSKF
jgi:hypothetical protein